MRGIELLMIAGIVAVITLAAWQGRRWIGIGSPSLTTNTHAAAGSTPAEGKAARDAKSKTALSHGSRRSLASSSLPPAEVNEALSVIVVPVRLAPTPEDLVPGTRSSEVLRVYGQPSLQFSYSENGSLVERMYYASAREGGFTVATLRDGKVVSAQILRR